MHKTGAIKATVSSLRWIIPACCLLAGKAFASDTSTSLTWLRSPFEPLVITQGPLRNQGINDQEIRFIQQSMNNYVHHNKVISAKRTLDELEASTNSCAGALIKTRERQQRNIIFSEPLGKVPGLRLIVQQPTYTQLKQSVPELDKGLSLSQLFRYAPDFVIGISNGRSYTQRFDQQITTYANNILQRTARDGSRGLLTMLRLERVHGIIEYPWLFNYLNQEQQPPLHTVSLNLQNLPSTVAGHIACSNSPGGREAIAQINKILQQHRASFRQYLLPYLTPLEQQQIEHNSAN